MGRCCSFHEKYCRVEQKQKLLAESSYVRPIEKDGHAMRQACRVVRNEVSTP